MLQEISLAVLWTPACVAIVLRNRCVNQPAADYVEHKHEEQHEQQQQLAAFTPESIWLLNCATATIRKRSGEAVPPRTVPS
jgi:hypothetical protein